MANAVNVRWEPCSVDGCIGVRPEGAQGCLVHDEQHLDAALKRLGDDGHIDARGVRVTAELLGQILTAAPREGDRPVLQSPTFDRAIFTAIARFDHMMFKGQADFGWATFERGARFDEAMFNGRADFGWATFRGQSEFIQATFKGGADFGRATFKGGPHSTRRRSRTGLGSTARHSRRGLGSTGRRSRVGQGSTGQRTPAVDRDLHGCQAACRR
jgi:hypothetical protein